jgi:hypothetical protein
MIAGPDEDPYQGLLPWADPGLPDFWGTTYQNGEKIDQRTTKYTKELLNIPKEPQNIPKDYKIYQKVYKIYQRTIKYTNIFHCKTLQNLPKMV